MIRWAQFWAQSLKPIKVGTNRWFELRSRTRTRSHRVRSGRVWQVGRVSARRTGFARLRALSKSLSTCDRDDEFLRRDARTALHDGGMSAVTNPDGSAVTLAAGFTHKAATLELSKGDGRRRRIAGRYVERST